MPALFWRLRVNCRYSPTFNHRPQDAVNVQRCLADRGVGGIHRGHLHLAARQSHAHRAGRLVFVVHAEPSVAPVAVKLLA